MNDMDRLLWRALEGALGTEKAAWLQQAPLTEIVEAKTKVAGFTIGDAAAHGARNMRVKKAEHRKIASSLRALGEVVGDVPREAKVSGPRKLAAAKKLRVIAEASNDPALTEKTAELRRELDGEIFGALVKTANALMGALKSEPAKNLAKGLAVGTGLVIPGVIGLNMASEHAAEQARNKALQTAAGVGGIAALGYGANRMMDNAAYHDRHKQAAANDVNEKISHLMTAACIDQYLAAAEQTEKIAELREINRDYGVTLLCELEHA